MPGHLAIAALATVAAAAPAHSARAHLPLGRRVAAAAPAHSARAHLPLGGLVVGAAPAHSARAHLPLGGHVAAASSFGAPRLSAAATPAGRPTHRSPHHAGRRPAADPAVTIADFHFTPPTTTIHVGDTITWTNDGPSTHTATARDGSFNTGTLSRGQSASHTFTRAGTFAYVCTIHPFMHGTITVLAAATAAPRSRTTTSSAPPSATTPPSTGAPAPARPAPAATGKPTLAVTGIDVLGTVAAGTILLGSGLALRRAARA